MPILTVGEYLKRWGYSSQRPLKRAYEQDPKAVECWLNEEYPAIQQRVQAEGAEICWGDESGLRSNQYEFRRYVLIGHPSEIHPSERQRVRGNYISSVSNSGAVHFMCYTDNFTGSVYIQLLERPIKSSAGKLFGITDRHPVHLRKKVQQLFEEHSEQIEVFYLLCYSPQLNPVEYLNSDVKQGVHDKPPIRDLNQLKYRVLSHLRKLQKLPDRMMRYFKHSSIVYAIA